MQEDQDYQFNYNKLIRFLARKEVNGYLFALADDARYIKQINKSLEKDLFESYKLITKVVFLDAQKDEPIFYQLSKASEHAHVLLVANLYETVIEEKKGNEALMHLNFSREALQQLPVRIVFWIQTKSQQLLSNLAADLYSQRSLSTIHFTGRMGSLDEQMLKLPEFEHYISSEEFKDAEERILTFERRLEDAEKSLYPIKRLVTEIVLPLLMDYATLGFCEKADILLNKYQTSFDKERIDQLVQLENIYYLLHKLDKSIEVLITAERRIKKSVVKQKNNQQLKILLSEIIQTLSSRYIEKGNLSEAKKKLEQCIDLILNLEPIYFQSIQQQLNLVSTYDRLGLVNTKLGNTNNALSFFSKSLAILELLAQNNINSEAIKDALATTYERIGSAYLNRGDIEKALTAFIKEKELTEQLCSKNTNSERYKKGLAISFLNIGDIYRAQHNIDEALLQFNHFKSLLEELYTSNPLSEHLLQGLSVAYERLGSISQENGDFEKAFEYFTKQKDLCEKLHTSNPQSEDLKKSLAISYEKLGNILNETGDFESAFELKNKGIKIAESLFNDNPSSFELGTLFATSLANLGINYKTKGDYDKAIECFLKYIEIALPMYNTNSQIIELKYGLAICYTNLGILFSEQKNEASIGKDYLLKGQRLFQELNKQNPQVAYQDFLDEIGNFLNKV